MTGKNIVMIFGISVVFALSACQETPGQRSSADVPTAKEAAARQMDFGQYTVHYNAITTDQLNPQTARSYGISRSKSQVLLNVVIHENTDESSIKATSGKVSAKANNLTGQLKNLSMKEIKEGDAIYYIGETSISDGEHLTFKIQVQPAGATQSYDVTFQQQFYTK